MTCIVALKTPENILIGTDSGVTSDHLYSRMGPKIVRHREITIAYAGSIRAAQVLEHHVTVPLLPRRGRPERLLTLYLIKPLREALKAHCGDSAESGIVLVVAFRGGLWTVDQDYSLTNCTSTYAVAGEAEDVARGVLEALPDLSPKDKVRKALEIATKVCSSVHPPFHYITV